MRRCERCWEYTFNEVCPYCGGKTRNPEPPKFSPEDKYWRERLKAKGVLK